MELFLRFMLTAFLITFVVHFLYSRNSNRKDYYFSFIAVGIIVFFLSILLNSVKLELGFAFGLFAIFGIIRYRTDAIPIKEMTYLFVIIAIAVINALSNNKTSYAELLFINSAIIFILWLLEKILNLKQEVSIPLIYENIKNIHADKKDILLYDLKERTGITIHRFEINKIDFLKDTAELTLFYYEKNNN